MADYDFEITQDGDLDYKLDLKGLTNQGIGSDWLGSGESITSYTLSPDSGLTTHDDSLTDTNTSITVFVAPSGATIGDILDLAIAVVSDNTPPRKETFTMKFKIVAEKPDR